MRISTTDGQTLSMCFFDDHLTASPGVANVLTSLSFSIVGPGDFFFVSELEIESSDGSDPEKGRELNSNQTERTIKKHRIRSEIKLYSRGNIHSESVNCSTSQCDFQELKLPPTNLPRPTPQFDVNALTVGHSRDLEIARDSFSHVIRYSLFIMRYSN